MDPALELRGSTTARVLGPTESIITAAVVVPELVADNAVAQSEKQGATNGWRRQAEGESVGARRGRGRTGVGGGLLALGPPAVSAPAHAHALLVGQVQHARAPGHAQRARLSAFQADPLRPQAGREARLAGRLQGSARLLLGKEERGGGSSGEGRGGEREGRDQGEARDQSEGRPRRPGSQRGAQLGEWPRATCQWGPQKG